VHQNKNGTITPSHFLFYTTYREKASYNEPAVTVSLAREEAFQSWKLNFADKHATWLERKIYQAREKETFLPIEETRYLKYLVAFCCDHSKALIKAKIKGIFTRYFLFSFIVNLICALIRN
jgi:hypothetical protein